MEAKGVESGFERETGGKQKSPASLRGFSWWAWQGLNLRPLRCQRNAVRAIRRISANLLFSYRKTDQEQTGILRGLHAKLTQVFIAAVGLSGLARS
jgi:hypothetical protein